MEDRRRPVAERRPRRGAAEAGRPHLVEERVLGVAPTGGAAAVEDRRLPGGEGQGEVAAQVDELILDRREEPVVVEPGLADGDDRRVGGERGGPLPARVVRLRRGVRMDRRRRPPGAGSARRARGRAALDASSQPGTRSRSTPPTSAAASTSARSSANCGDWRWAWVSIRRMRGCRAIRREPARTRRRGSTSSRGKSGLGTASVPGSAAWAPQASSSRSAGPPDPSAAHG